MSKRKSPKKIAAGFLVAVLLVVGIALAATRHHRSNPPASEATTNATQTPVVTATSPTTPKTDSFCGLGGVELSGTVTTAPPASWRIVGSTSVPTVDGAGPGKIASDGYGRCYAHTPTGAVSAAVNFLGESNSAALVPELARDSVVPGPGRDQMMKNPNADDGQDNNSGTQARLTIAGFNVLEYTGDAASVDVAFTMSNGPMGAQVYNLAWRDGDWKVTLSDNGQLPSEPTTLQTLTGYHLWSA